MILVYYMSSKNLLSKVAVGDNVAEHLNNVPLNIAFFDDDMKFFLFEPWVSLAAVYKVESFEVRLPLIVIFFLPQSSYTKSSPKDSLNTDIH